jgi:hypothetical protein
VTLVGIECEQPAGLGVDRLAAGLDPGGALDNAHPRPLLHLVVTELAAGLDADEDGATLVVRVEDDRIARAFRGLDRAQVPGLHGRGS